MEEVLDVYERPLEKKHPVIGFDEKPCQLLGDVMLPIPAKPGSVKRVDSEYQRYGTANLFGWAFPLTGKRDVWVTERRTTLDYAHALKRVSDAFPEAQTIIIVQDNLNTHKKAALYDAFEPKTAHRLAQRFEFHFTPKHGSWLNVQESEWSALERQALGERPGDRERLEHLVKRWLDNRRERAVTINWQFTTSDARLKLRGLYPQISD